MITAEHAAAMREGRARQLAEATSAREAQHAAYSAWVERDGALWRTYRAAEGDEIVPARDAWQANLSAMPPLAWAGDS